MPHSFLKTSATSHWLQPNFLSLRCPVASFVIYSLISFCPQNILLLNLAEIMEYSSLFLVLPTFCFAFGYHLWHYFFWECPLTLQDLSLSFTTVQSHSHLGNVSGSPPCLQYFILSPRLFFNRVNAWVGKEMKNCSFESREVSWNTRCHVEQNDNKNQLTQGRQNCQSTWQERVSGKHRTKARDERSRKFMDRMKKTPKKE